MPKIKAIVYQHLQMENNCYNEHHKSILKTMRLHRHTEPVLASYSVTRALDCLYKLLRGPRKGSQL